MDADEQSQLNLLQEPQYLDPIQEEDREHTTQVWGEDLTTIKQVKTSVLVSSRDSIGSSKSRRNNKDKVMRVQDGLNDLTYAKYKGEDDHVVCGRFPHLDFCACPISCNVGDIGNNPVEVFDNVYIGDLQSAFQTRFLVESGVTHILNLSTKAYTKRHRYFKYFDIEVFDDHNEDVKKHFRISNRFIDEGRKVGKVLVHCQSGKSLSPTFVLAYLIARERVKLKQGMQILREHLPEVEPNENFMQQLIEYDLEVLSTI